MHYFANPTRFLRLVAAVRPYVLAVMVATLGYGLYAGTFGGSEALDRNQLESTRIIYIHVPAAWSALFIYVGIAIASFVAIVWRHPLALIAARSSAPIGAVFTAVALITGALWGRPTWGTYWMWDARLTSMLVLFFLYLGYMALWQAMDDEEKAGRATSILAMVGLINIPIIKFSVDWWNTIHQGASVLRSGGPSIEPSILWPILSVAVAFKAYYLWVLFMRMEMLLDCKRLTALRQRAARPALAEAAE